MNTNNIKNVLNILGESKPNSMLIETRLGSVWLEKSFMDLFFSKPIRNYKLEIILDCILFLYTGDFHFYNDDNIIYYLLIIYYYDLELAKKYFNKIYHPIGIDELIFEAFEFVVEEKPFLEIIK